LKGRVRGTTVLQLPNRGDFGRSVFAAQPELAGLRPSPCAAGCCCRKQSVLLLKRNHIAIEQPRLLDLTGMPGAVEDLHLAARDTLLQRRRARMRAVFAAGEDDGRALYARVVIRHVWLRLRFELINDRLLAASLVGGGGTARQDGERR